MDIKEGSKHISQSAITLTHQGRSYTLPMKHRPHSTLPLCAIVQLSEWMGNHTSPYPSDFFLQDQMVTKLFTPKLAYNMVHGEIYPNILLIDLHSSDLSFHTLPQRFS